MPEMVPLDFTKNDVTWVVSKLYGAAGALVAEVIEMKNWLLCFGCVSEELRVVVTSLAVWFPPPPPPWAANCALMACGMVALHKRPGVLPMGIAETL